MADGINKLIALKKETTWGTKPSAGSAQLMPRVTGSFQLEKDAYASNSINPSQQVRDSRHGTRRATGSLEAELQGGAFELLQAAALRRDFTGSVTTGAVIVIEATTTGYERSTGSFITDGFRAGMIVGVSGFTTAANNGRKIVTAVSATVLTARSIDGTALVIEAEGDTVTIALAGQRTFTPLTGHTDDSFSVEEWHEDIDLSRITLGQQVNVMGFNVSPNSMCTISFEFLGQDAEAPSGTRYFTSPTDVPAEGTMSAADGVALVAGVATCKLTSLQLSVNNNITQESVIACPGIGAKSRGKVMINGSFTAILDDDTYLDYFDQESEVSFSYTFNAQDGEAISLYAPRMKINSATVDDGEKVHIITCNFDMLEYVGSDTGIEKTTLIIQDTTLS